MRGRAGYIEEDEPEAVRALMALQGAQRIPLRMGTEYQVHDPVRLVVHGHVIEVRETVNKDDHRVRTFIVDVLEVEQPTGSS